MYSYLRLQSAKRRTLYIMPLHLPLPPSHPPTHPPTLAPTHQPTPPLPLATSRLFLALFFNSQRDPPPPFSLSSANHHIHSTPASLFYPSAPKP